MDKHDLPVNAGILRWAREIAGLSLAEAADRAKIAAKASRGDLPPIDPAARLEMWESGQETPTRGQLELLAKAYRRPPITFFLARPPKQIGCMADFRVLPHAGVKPTVEFSAFQRRLNALHAELRQLVQTEGASPLQFVGSLTPEVGIAPMAAILRQALGAEEGKKFSNADEYFRYLREKAQELGIYIMLMGDMGSWQSQISPEEFRGIAIADKYAPLIVINQYDARAARLFTLAHELAHIWLGFGGVSNNNVFVPKKLSANERFCNAVAGEFLVPAKTVAEAWRQRSGSLADDIAALAKKFCVSGAVIARRLADLGLITVAEYGQLLKNFHMRWQKQKATAKNGPGGPNVVTMTRYCFGKKALATFKRAIDNGSLTLLEAARALDISAARFEKAIE